jgi:hypothetical protein
MENVNPKTIEIHYITTPNYRIYNVSGTFGGITPRGKIYLEIFTERNPLPQQETYEITNGKLGNQPLDKQTKTGIVRDVEACLIMDIEDAVSIHNWLGDKIAKHKELIKGKE